MKSDILVCIDHHRNRELIVDVLRHRPGTSVRVGEPGGVRPDLVVVDGLALDRLWEEVAVLRSASEPIFLPVLLIVSRSDVSIVTRRMWLVVDELLLMPVEDRELGGRIEILLRARKMSVEVNDRKEDLEALAIGLSHDLNNLLAAMRVSTALLAGELKDAGGETRNRLFHLESACENAVELTEELISYARITREPSSATTVDLGSAIGAAREYVLVAGGRADVAIDVQTPLPAVQGDQALTAMVFRNLLLNAIRYVDEEISPRIEVVCERVGDRVRVEVSDNGVGLDSGDIEHVFRPFTRLGRDTDKPGWGLGLATVRRAAEQMGGVVGASPREGGGSRFWVELPASSPVSAG